MAQALRLTIFLVALAIAERVFKRLASPAEIQRDLEDRTRNPPL